MMKYWPKNLIGVLVVFTVLWPASAQAFDDAFPFGKTIHSRNFAITLALGVDEKVLVDRLNIDPEHEILTGKYVLGVNYSPDNVGDLVDALFSWVTGVLGMPINGYAGEIRVVAGIGQLNAVTRRLYGRDAHSDKAFFIAEKNTIYVVAPAFTKEILGHEMAHAVICNFLPSLLSENIQEVLARYVEYELRRVSLQP